MGTTLLSRESATPSKGGGATELPNFGVSPLFMPIHPLMQKDNVRQDNTRGSVFLGVSQASHPKGAEPQRFPIFGVLIIYVHTL